MDLYPVLVFITLDLMFVSIPYSRGDVFQPIKNPVYWGPWSDWSECSNTCGQGLMTRRRDCLEWNLRTVKKAKQWRCRGRALRQEICYISECGSHNASKEKDECWELNARGRIYFQHWQPVTDDNPCQVSCQEKNSGLRRMVRRVNDGTFCTVAPLKPGRCKAGICQMPDSPLCLDPDGDKTKMDMCFICGGDNSTCIFLKGNFGHTNNYAGQRTIINQFRIPRGSTFIRVEKFGNSPNTLALIDSYGRYIINGQTWRSQPGVYKAEGSKWTYSNAYSMESISAKGPTIGDITFKLKVKDGTFSSQRPQNGTFRFWGSLRLHPHLAYQWRLATHLGKTAPDEPSDALDHNWWDPPPKQETQTNSMDGDGHQPILEESQKQLREEESVIYPVSKDTIKATTSAPHTTRRKTDPPAAVIPQNSNSHLNMTGGKVNKIQTNIDIDSQELSGVDKPKFSSPELKNYPTTTTPTVFPGKNSKKKTRKRPRDNTHRKKKPKKRNGSRKRQRNSPFTLNPAESCFPCPRVKATPKQFCSSDFVTKVHVNRKKTIKKEIRYDVTILSTYLNRVKLMQREFIWVESLCRCPHMKAKRTYILMGHMKDRTDRETRLVLTKKNYVRGFSLGSERRMRDLARVIRCDR